MLSALTLLGISIAGPQARLGLASPSSTVVLTLDVTGSMNAKDIVAPTLDRRILKAAIQGSRANGGTAIGDGMMLALAQIFPDGSVEFAGDPARAERRRPSLIKSAWTVSRARAAANSSAILLLTDGQNTDGIDPQEAAESASARGVRVFAVGFGTSKGVVAGMGSSSVRVAMNEHMLRAIAETTHGEYFHASSGAQLQEIYVAVERRLIGTNRTVEITALFYLAAAFAIGLAGLRCVGRHGRVV